MRFLKLATQEIFTKQEIRMLENTSIAEHITDLTHMGYEFLKDVPPTYNSELYNCVEDGWEYFDNTYKIKYVIVAKTLEELAVAKKHKVPASIAMWQARDFLIENELIDDVLAVINAIPDPIAKKRAQSKFEFSSTVRRDDPLLNYVCTQAGYTSAQVDDWFIGASAT